MSYEMRLDLEERLGDVRFQLSEIETRSKELECVGMKMFKALKKEARLKKEQVRLVNALRMLGQYGR